MNNTKEKVVTAIDNLRNKKSRIYFIVNDTKGNPKASIRYIYQVAESLKINGFNPIILHEKSEYSGVGNWLGDWYMQNIPHQPIDGQNLEITPDDFLVVPEIYGFIMEQVTNLPCSKIVLTQSYTYMLETLQPGQNWNQLGFFKCITTSDKQKEYVSSIMRNVSFDVISPLIPDFFVKNNLPQKPIIAIHTREHTDTINIIKSFYLKFPQFRWFTFRDIRGLPQKDMATVLKDCCLSVWVDDIGGFGTFPLESMACGVPVIGKIPDMIPEWMINDEKINGIWTNEKIYIIDRVAEFIQNWIEDSIRPEIYENMQSTIEKYNNKENFTNLISLTFKKYFEEKANIFEKQLIKIDEDVDIVNDKIEKTE